MVRADIETIRSTNRARLLRFLFRNGNTPQFKIAQEMNLTQGSVSRIISECLQAGLVIQQEGFASPRVGRRPVPIALNPSIYCVAAIHLGALWIDIGLINLQGQVFVHTRHNRTTTSPETIVDFIAEQITKSVVQYERILLAVSITLNAQVNSKQSVVIGHNMFDWHGVPLGLLLEQKLKVRAIVDTNVYAMALAEYTYHHPLSTNDSLLLVNIGSTIGMGLVVDSDIVRGSTGLAGFLEHSPWQDSGPMCSCGLRGCMTSVLSDRALLEEVRRMRPQSKFSSIESIIELSSSDAGLREILYYRAAKVGELLAMLASIYNPAHLVLSGSVTLTEYFDKVKESFTRHKGDMDIETPTSEPGIPFPLLGAGIVGLGAVFSPDLLLNPGKLNSYAEISFMPTLVPQYETD